MKMKKMKTAANSFLMTTILAFGDGWVTEGLASLALNAGAALYTYKMIKEIGKIIKSGSVKRCEVQHWYQTQNPHVNLNLLKLFICNWDS